MERSSRDCSYGLATSLCALSYRRERSSLDLPEGIEASTLDYLFGVDKYVSEYSSRIKM